MASLYIRITCTIVLFVSQFSGTVYAQLPPSQQPEYWVRDQSKSDEFNGTALDTVKWWTIDACTFTDSIPHGYNGGGGVFFRPQNVSVSNGNLVLTADYNPDSLDLDHPCVHYHVYPFFSGGLISPLANGGPGLGGYGSFSYGYYEIRAKLPGYYDAANNPVGYGFAPAFWFYYQYPGGGCIIKKEEVDVIEPNSAEYYDAKTNVVGWHDETGACTGYKVGQDSMRSPHPLFEDFHTYSVALLPDRIIFYFDDEPFFSADTLSSPNIAHSLQTPPWLTVFIDFQLGGNNVPQASPSAPFPHHMYVDYFRYYRVNPEYNVENVLFQNSPNPVKGNTEIEYSVDIHSKDAWIEVRNIYGFGAGSVRLSVKGKGKIVLTSVDLIPGIYFYSLFVDNKMIDTKKMVVIK